MKVDAKLPSHDGNKVRSICLKRYKDHGSRLKPGVGPIDFTFAEMGLYKWDPVELKVVVVSWSR
eukprot:10430876-Heterocapsa_arctica.AAC.1